jgi:hypothetical protein
VFLGKRHFTFPLEWNYYIAEGLSRGTLDKGNDRFAVRKTPAQNIEAMQTSAES